MEKQLSEQQLLIKVRNFTIVGKDGSIDVTIEMLEDLSKKELIVALQKTDKVKYKIQYAIT